MAEAKEYAGITRATMDCLKLRYQPQDMTSFDGDRGTLEHHGVRVSVAYIEAEQKLKIDIIEKPFFIPEDLVWTLLDNAVKGCADN